MSSWGRAGRPEGDFPFDVGGLKEKPQILGNALLGLQICTVPLDAVGDGHYQGQYLVRTQYRLHVYQSLPFPLLNSRLIFNQVLQLLPGIGLATAARHRASQVVCLNSQPFQGGAQGLPVSHPQGLEKGADCSFERTCTVAQFPPQLARFTPLQALKDFHNAGLEKGHVGPGRQQLGVGGAILVDSGKPSG